MHRTSPPPPRRLLSVDVLRGLAALVVVIGHVPFPVDPSSPLATLLAAGLRLGRIGVPLFLVLSGFCIHLGNARTLAAGRPLKDDWAGFWRRRTWRLYPPYVVAIAFGLAVYALAGNAAFPHEEPMTAAGWDVLAHLLMVHNLFALFCYGVGNGPLWTLGLEEQLYLLYIPLLALRRARTIVTVLAVTLAVTLAWQVGWRFVLGPDDGVMVPTLGPAPFALGRWLKWPLGFWFSWALGAAAAEAYAGGLRLPGWCFRRSTALALAAVGLGTSHAALHALGLDRGPLAGVFGALSSLSDLSYAGAGFVLLNRWVRLEREGRFGGWSAGRLAGLGVMSYSLYLTHMPVIRFLVPLVPAAGIVGGLVRIGVVTGVCLAVGAAFFWLVERHFLRAEPAQPRAPRPQPTVYPVESAEECERVAVMGRP